MSQVQSSEAQLLDSEYHCYALTLKMTGLGTFQRRFGLRTICTVIDTMPPVSRFQTIWWLKPRMKGRWQ